MPQVQLAANFFKKEREQAYANPPIAIWRELFQNSIDQDVSQIDIALWLANPGDNHINLTFSDNGPGMSRKVLDDVYFNIGNSTKDNDPTKIGGMGRARILTCFAMQSYRILSQDYEVVGHGGHYDVSNHAWTAGCKLIIEVDEYSIATMERALERFLHESRISARLFLNGERVLNKSLNPGRHVRDLTLAGQTFARVYVNKSVKSQKVVVRVNGVSMFTNWTEANSQVVVELEASTSRKVLTANRDGLRGEYRSQLDRFLAELAIDTTSALRSRLRRRSTVAQGGGMKIVRKPVTHSSRSEVNQKVVQFGASLQAGVAGQAFAPLARLDPGHVDDTYENAADLDSWLAQMFGDIYLFDETDNTAMRKALSSYNPDNWKISYKHIRGTSRPFRKGGNIIRLLLMWHTAINYAIEVGLEPLGKTEVPFAVGFVFADDKLADHREQDNGHVFCLCPVNGDGKLNYAASNRDDLKRLMTYAKHEVTHIAVAMHSETFSSMRESIDMRFDESECLRRMKDTLRHAKGV
jgi:Histidine kinase-, DNA gyrase B-, and HSP90-like ATPase